MITFGSIDAAVVEQQQVEGGVLDPYPTEPIQVMPGQTVSKIVSMKAGGIDAWVRGRYDVVFYDPQGEVMEVPAEEVARIMTIPMNDADWTLKDGWWYYNTALQAEMLTTPLFEEVRFSGPNMGNEYQKCSVVITVHVQTVQKANNGATVWEAAGWPEA